MSHETKCPFGEASIIGWCVPKGIKGTNPNNRRFWFVELPRSVYNPYYFNPLAIIFSIALQSASCTQSIAASMYASGDTPE